MAYIDQFDREMNKTETGMLPAGLGKLFKSEKTSVGSNVTALCFDGGIKLPIVEQPLRERAIVIIINLYIIQTSVLR